jgi:hypothetical protein
MFINNSVLTTNEPTKGWQMSGLQFAEPHYALLFSEKQADEKLSQR